LDIFSLVGKITINYADAVNNIEKVSKSAKSTAETLEDVDKKAGGAGNSVEDAGQAAKNADSGFTTWKATLANLVSTAITKVISGCTQLAAKMADVTKSAVGHYAEYEQLVGGVETLFKDSSGKLIDYAKKAYKTAGMSSNKYMDTATSFAASLIQGLGGDTAKAVELTNLAITDMSDNANKMGTDIGSIQDAYQGFAKQNYTMLDNLKLGYGGTQSEMIRLINDSGVLGEKIESLDNVTFDQMIEAIHKIQDNLGITGTTALEAGTTISGSWSSVQALFENILTKVGSKLAPTVMGFLQQLSDWMETVDWDAFATSVGDALQRVFDWIQKIDFTTFFEKGMDGVENFLEKLGGLIEDVPKIIQTFKDWSPLIAGVAAGFVTLKVAMAISSLISAVSTAIGILTGVEETATVAQTGLNAAMDANPAVFIISIIAGLVAALITLWNTNDGFREAVTAAWDSIKSVWESVKEAFSNLAESIGEKIESIKNFFGNLKDAASEKFSAMKEVVSEKFSQIKGTMGTIMQAAKDTVSEKLQNMKTAYAEHGGGINGIAAAAMEGVKGYYSAGYTFIDNLTGGKLSAVADKFKSKMSEAKQAVLNKISEIKNSFSSGLGNAYSTVTNILGNIKNKFSSILEGAKNIVSNAINRIKSFFNFSWSLPKLKLPHISISGSFSLTPPSVPHFGIEWYKKAMDDGMIMNQPTIFGYNAKSNQFLAGGEAGSETVVGTQSLMDMINSAVQDSDNDLESAEVLKMIYAWMKNGGLRELMIDVLTNYVEFDVEGREVARLVRKYA
jgi:phage-related protein